MDEPQRPGSCLGKVIDRPPDGIEIEYPAQATGDETGSLVVRLPVGAASPTRLIRCAWL